MTGKRRKKLLLPIAGLLLAAVLIAAAVYLNTYYPASEEALQAAETAVSVRSGGRELRIFGEDLLADPDFSGPVILFYPGGKVQAEAYAPLCAALSDSGTPCVLMEMPFRLAVFDSGAASSAVDYLTAAYGCSDFYLAGHSLGGVMAAHYAASAVSVRGLILLASYCSDDLSGTGMRVLSIYGSEDGVLSMDAYNNARPLAPADFTEAVIPGGCHAFFGSYGLQSGDGTPAITREAQTAETVSIITDWLRAE